ncbi:MAG: MerR family transcriptional regulator [Victivallaceae bacterium]|nr:MerR family transcriptional regulator [Victivallaceae bacterium]
MEKRIYLVSDLAGELGVPRTTINDWLSKFDRYIDSENRGKRKVYNENSLTVLKEISALRASGKSAFDIEKALSARYAVHPDPVPPAAQPLPENSGSPASADSKEPSGSQTDPGAMLMVTHAAEKISAGLFDEFTKLTDQMARQEVRHKQSLARLAMLSGLLLLLTLGLGVIGGAAFLKFVEVRSQSDAALTRRMVEGTNLVRDDLAEKNRQQILRQEQLAKRQNDTVDRIMLGVDRFQIKSSEREERLEKEIRMQKELFSDLVRRIEEQNKQNRAAELAAARNSFERELELVRRTTAIEIDKYEKASRNSERTASELRGKLDATDGLYRTLKRDFETMQKENVLLRKQIELLTENKKK